MRMVTKKDETSNEKQEKRPKLNRLRERGIIEIPIETNREKREIFQRTNQ